MTSTRRILILIGLTAAVVIGASVPAFATYTASVTVPTTVATGTVAAPAWVAVNDSCVTTTTTVKQTVSTNPGTGATTTTYYSSTTTTAPSASNVQGTTTETVNGPGPLEKTTTTVTKNTDLHVAASWAASASRGVNGYQVNANLADGSAFPMMQTATTTATGVVDADNLAYQPRLSVTTLTTYGWTATSAKTAVLSC
jgi:hypothetical protein